MLKTLLSAESPLRASASAWKRNGSIPSAPVTSVPKGPCPFAIFMKAFAEPNTGNPASMPRIMLMLVMNFAACSGSSQMALGGVRAATSGPQRNAQMVCALAVLTLMVPCPHTVTVRFLGSRGSGSRKVE